MSEIQSFSVSRLVQNIAGKLSKINISQWWISGELSNVRRVSGNYYFDLKDDQAQISCTMWNSIARSLPFQLEDGLQVLVRGSLNVYVKRGQMQFSIVAIQPNGIGALFIELEQRRKRLEALGYFNPAHKTPRPAWIENLAIVTGNQTAALQDVMKTLQSRWPMMKVTLYPALVQGQNAPAQIIKALKKADQGHHDAILLVRGGGSMEDLFCFNDENIIKTLYDMKTYTVTGIGHEIDTTLADLAADHRAVTPTAAAQWVSPDQREVMAYIRQAREDLIRKTRAIFDQNASHLVYLQANPYLMDPNKWTQDKKIRLHENQAALQHLQSQFVFAQKTALQSISTQLVTQMRSFERLQSDMLHARQARLMAASPNGRVQIVKADVNRKKQDLFQNIQAFFDASLQKLNGQTSLLNAVSPLAILNRGYAMVSHNGHPVTSTEDLHIDQQVFLQFKDGSASALIEDIDHGKSE